MPCLVQINTTLNWGSTGRIAEQIAIKAEQKGWECHIAHGGRYIGDSVIPSIRISSKWDNYAHALYGELMGGHGFGSTTSTNTTAAVSMWHHCYSLFKSMATLRATRSSPSGRRG